MEGSAAQSVSACIDKLEFGVLHGWAYCSELPDEHVSFFVVVNGKTVGRYLASKYRADLENAGFGNGEHGFEAPIDSWFLRQEKLNISLLDSNQNAIECTEFTINPPITALSVSSVEKADFSLLVRLGAADLSDPCKKRVRLYQADEFILEREVDSAESSELNLPIPVRFIDGVPRRYSLFVAGEAIPAWCGEEAFFPRLKELCGEGITVDAAFQHRYKAFSERVRHSRSLEEVAQICAAHDILASKSSPDHVETKLIFAAQTKPEISVLIYGARNESEVLATLSSIFLAPTNIAFGITVLGGSLSLADKSKLEQLVANIEITDSVAEQSSTIEVVNVAVGHSLCDAIVLLPAGVEVASFWLDGFLLALFESEKYAFVGGALISKDGGLIEAGGVIFADSRYAPIGYGANVLDPAFSHRKVVDVASSQAICANRAVWQKLGGLDKSFQELEYALIDFAYAAKKAGYDSVFTPEVKLFASVPVYSQASSDAELTADELPDQIAFREKYSELAEGALSSPGVASSVAQGVSQKIFVFDATTPKLGRDAGSYAAIQEIKLIRSLGFDVIFVPLDFACDEEDVSFFAALGVSVLCSPYYLSLEAVFDLHCHNMSAIYVIRVIVANQVIHVKDKYRVNAPVLFNNADLHFLRELRIANNSRDEDAMSHALHTRELELAVMKRATFVLTYSDVERTVLISHGIDAEKIMICPWVVWPKPNTPTFYEREGVAFLGGFSHAPNVEAVRYFDRYVAPLLELRSDIHLYVYGNQSQKMLEGIESSRISIIGYVNDLAEVYNRHRIFVTPLISGAGIKGKVLDALAYGLPTIVSDIACEGTGLVDDYTALVANSPEEWVNAIVRLYSDEILWNTLRENAKTLLESRYSEAVGLKKMRDIFETVGLNMRNSKRG